MSECIDPKLGLLLHAYELDALSEEDAERFEIHLLKCEHCFEELNGFSTEIEVLRTDNGIKDAAGRFSEENVDRRAHDGKLWNYLLPRLAAVPKSLALIAMLLILIIPVYLGFIGPAIMAPGKIQVIYLTDLRSGQDTILRLSEGDQARIEFVYRDAVEGKTYNIAIRHLDDNIIVKSLEFSEFGAEGRGTLGFSLRDKKPGLYVLVIIDPEKGPSVPLKEYTFRIAE